MFLPSKYNHLIDYDQENSLIFNARTLSIAMIEKANVGDVQDLFSANSINDLQEGALQPLLDNGFILPKQTCELEQIRQSLRQGRQATDEMTFIIAPTLGCNFDCPYCFESEESRSLFNNMSVPTQDKLVEFIQAKASTTMTKKLTVLWYGGEPLLATKVIERLSCLLIRFCDENKIEYAAHIVTNAYKLTKKAVDILEEARVQTVQITLDGPKHVHDTRRILKNGKGSYDKILSHLPYAASRLPNIQIRVNVDKNNIDGVKDIIDDLSRRELNNRISVYLGCIDDNEHNDLESSSLFSKNEFAQVDLSFSKEHLSTGFSAILSPKAKSRFCSADHENSYMIGPNGEMYQCWDDFGDQNLIVGYIFSSTKLNHELVDDYMSFDPTNDPKCSQCTVMPLCMGGCPKQRIMNGGIPQCGVYQYNLDDRIKEYVANNLMGEAL